MHTAQTSNNNTEQYGPTHCICNFDLHTFFQLYGRYMIFQPRGEKALCGLKIVMAVLADSFRHILIKDPNNLLSKTSIAFS